MNTVTKLAKNPSGATPIEAIENFLAKLKNDYPQFGFQPGAREHWSPGSRTITYNPSQAIEDLRYGLLHELAHAILGHSSYESDLELVKLESQAWHLAAKIGKKYRLNISDDSIQNCLDTYRDWLHRRSTCPKCGANGLQQNTNTYKCLNCQAEWSVTSGSFVRAYRRQAVSS